MLFDLSMEIKHYLYQLKIKAFLLDELNVKKHDTFLLPVNLTLRYAHRSALPCSDYEV
jgi:hypothetical protein